MNPGNTPPPSPQQQQQKICLLPRREIQLQGSRPSPLRVSNDSHKIKKPPVAPPAQQAAPPPASRKPVIIYTISPKIIHVETADFMDLVQRLTGPDTSLAAEAAAGLHSPAAKLAAIHRTIQSPGAARPMDSSAADADILRGPQLDRKSSMPGILSPVPASLPPISPAFFSPSIFDSSFLNFLHDLSPAAFQVERPYPGGFAGGTFNSPVNSFSPSIVPSPGAAAWDLFNHFQNF